MMSVGLHCRLARPARAAALQEFVDYAKSYGREVWICTREQIANHWYENHLPRGIGNPIDPAEFGARVNKGNKFSFLGNLTTPRSSEASSTTPSSSPMNDMKDMENGGTDTLLSDLQNYYDEQAAEELYDFTETVKKMAQILQ